ncbi:ethanolamine kinase 2-like isoform X3 [Stegodyphus dumicola]|uniref:ethanolamine kinase 2-like isoform X3 n=1 Tax=Stegodyphus dumicola TaxID=202533 RepID=UPI0015AF36A7|nr:ethanolamine kinase 2-like isoform X3 [Stegodyphus dumicola]
MEFFLRDVWKSSYRWLDDIEGELLKRNESFSKRQWYEEEFEWLKKEMEKINSPIVYCHNDLHGGNILLRENALKISEPDIILIDFEFGGYNYRFIRFTSCQTWRHSVEKQHLAFIH